MTASSPCASGAGRASRGRVARGVTLAMTAILAGAPGAARAEDSETARVLAEELFADAKALMEDGRIDDACPKLAESQRIAPGGGTLLLLGICHERQGKLATAWRELRAGLAAAQRSGRVDRVATAEEHLAIVEPRLTRVTVVRPPAERVPDLEVRIDGVSLTFASDGTPLPLDPGEHVLEAVAPGRVSWTTSIAIRGEQGSRTINVPELAPEPILTPPRPASRTAPIAIATGVGLVWVGLSALWGARALDAEEHKPKSCAEADATCVGLAHGREDERNRAATLSTIAGAMGAASFGAAIVLYVTRPRERAAQGVRIVPSTRAGLGASLVLSF
jgi:hypothetical protein